MRQERVWYGMLLLVVSSIAYSTAGFFTRLVTLDVWTVLFWRGIFGGAAIAAFIVVDRGSGCLDAVRAIGRPGLAVAFLSTLATIAFITALRIAPVADVMVIAAIVPFVAAAASWLLIGERERWPTLLASVVALVGVGVMVGMPSVPRDLAGSALAFVMPVAIGLMMVIMRKHRKTSMTPAVALSAFLCSACVLPLATPAAARGVELLYLGLFGTVQFGLGLLTLALGMRRVSATRAGLIATIETPLGCAFVWAAFGEAPATMTLIGGAIALAAVIADVLANRPA